MLPPAVNPSTIMAATVTKQALACQKERHRSDVVRCPCPWQRLYRGHQLRELVFGPGEPPG
jgi:hypothetical protein